MALVIAVGAFVFTKSDKPAASGEALQPGMVVQPLAVGESEPITAITPTKAGTEGSVAGGAVNEPSKSEMTLAEFSELAQKTLLALPTLQNLRGLTNEEVHETPMVLRQAGHDLGEIAQALHDNPALASEAAAFYRTCFTRDDFPASVRGLCLADHRNLRIANGDRAEWTVQELEVPREVLSLALKIPTT